MIILMMMIIIIETMVRVNIYRESNQINLRRLVANVLVKINLSVKIFVENLLLFRPIDLLLPILNELFVPRNVGLRNYGEFAFFHDQNTVWVFARAGDGVVDLEDIFGRFAVGD